MSKRETRKPRTEHIYGTTAGEVTEIGFTLNEQTGEISFTIPMKDIYSEASYDRPKGPKILSRIPQSNTWISFDVNGALEKNFDFLCAVDTNTRDVQGKKVSVSGIVIFETVWLGGARGLERHWRYYTPFCLEFVDLKVGQPENFGWLAAWEQLDMAGHIKKDARIGMVVDSDLGSINDYNQRKRPIVNSFFLPKNVSLIYASADSGKENFHNRMLSAADLGASQCLEAVSDGRVPFNDQIAHNDFYERMRILYSKNSVFGRKFC